MVFIDKLFYALRESRKRVAGAFRYLVEDHVSPESIDRLEETLLSADMSLNTVDDIMNIVQNYSKNNFLEEVAVYMAKTLANENDLELPSPSVLLVVGVNGTGKTTTTAKLAHYYKQLGKPALLIAADTYRAAAIDQLQQWCRCLDMRLIYNEKSKDPAAVLFDGLQAASAEKSDLVIVDTAGRLHTYKNLMNELAKMTRVINNRFDAYHLISLITIDANLGQNSFLQAQEFAKSIKLDGAILTKMDGTARGGIVFALKKELDVPVRFIGIGEELEDLDMFRPQEYIHSLLGINGGQT